MPIKVLIYCTYGQLLYADYPNGRESKVIKLGGYKVSGKDRIGNMLNGKVIGEFVCDRISEYRAEFTDLHHFNAMHEDVCLNEIKKVGYYDEDDGDREYYYETSNAEENPDDCDLLKGSCLTFNELRKYIGSTFYDKSFYGLHISQLKIYDKPKELSEFKHDTILHTRFNGYKEPLKRPPQSWCYVED